MKAILLTLCLMVTVFDVVTVVNIIKYKQDLTPLDRIIVKINSKDLQS